MIFIFQSFNGYGKILLNLPFHLTITNEGILTAFKFVTQILLIFLMFGTAIYSSKKEEILFYFRKPLKIHPLIERNLEKYFRIGMFSFYMVPNSLKIQSQFSKNLQSDKKLQASRLKKRVNLVFDNIYQFIKVVLTKSEEEYLEFVTQGNQATNYSPIPVVSFKNILTVIFVLIIHSILIWRLL